MTDEGSKQEILSRIVQTVGALSKLKTIMERQEHYPHLQNQNDWLLGHLNLPVRMPNMDPYCRVREEDTSYRNEMLPKASRHLLQGSCQE